jgi:hypothetical protein
MHLSPGCDDSPDSAPSWVGRRVRFNTAFLSGFGDRVQFQLPGADQEISAIGTIPSAPYLFRRYYLGVGEGFIELCCRSDQTVSQSLFVKDMEEFPYTKTRWDSWLAEGVGRLGSPVVLHGDHDYRRMWRPSERWERPVTMVESVSSTGMPNAETIEQQCLLYGRTILAPLGSGRPEFEELLLLQSDGRSIKMFMGIGLPAPCYEVLAPLKV